MKEKTRNMLNYLFIFLIFVIMSGGIIIVNIINTKALSPLGNTKENYKMVSKEFGEDFSKFIKDNSVLKIYKEKDDILIKIGENNFIINNKLNTIINKYYRENNNDLEDSH